MIRIGCTAVLVALFAGCGGGSYSSSSPATPTSPSTPAATTATITIQASARTLATAAFVPNPAMVASSGKVTWANTDSTTHDMVSDTGIWDSGRIAPGDHFDFTFATKGSYPYHCSIHPGMVGTVVVQ